MAIIYECERCGNQEKDKPEFLRGLKLKQVDYYGNEFQEWDKIYNICARCAKYIHSELEKDNPVSKMPIELFEIGIGVVVGALGAIVIICWLIKKAIEKL